MWFYLLTPDISIEFKLTNVNECTKQLITKIITMKAAKINGALFAARRTILNC